MITKNIYDDYEKALECLNMKKLSERRTDMSLKFAKNCLKHEKVKTFFPMNKRIKRTRNPEHYEVNFGRTKRYCNSTIPTLQRLLNSEQIKKKSILKHFLRRNGC